MFTVAIDGTVAYNDIAARDIIIAAVYTLLL